MNEHNFRRLVLSALLMLLRYSCSNSIRPSKLDIDAWEADMMGYYTFNRNGELTTSED